MKGINLFTAVVLLGFAGTTLGECSVNVSGVNFGTYDPFSTTPTDTSGDIHINCTADTPYIITLDAGINSSYNYFPRKMRNISGISTLEYNLYRDVSYSEVWGDGQPGTYTVSGSTSGTTDTLKIFGRIPSDQRVESGSYTDVISVLVEW